MLSELAKRTKRTKNTIFSCHGEEVKTRMRPPLWSIDPRILRLAGPCLFDSASRAKTRSKELLPFPSHADQVGCEKYVNIPSEKYIYVHIYVCICVYTYLCKMDERWSYASLSKKWMSTGLMLACHKNG